MLTSDVQTAAVIGAGSGMGRASARALGGRGIRVLAADLDRDAAEETARLINWAGGRAEGLAVDVASSESVEDLFSVMRERSPRLDLLVQTAAILGPTASLEEIDDETWRRMMAVNLDGTFFCARAAVRWMKDCGGGRIVLFSSVASLTPTPGAIAYSAAKGGVNMLARSLAVEAAPHNIRVNVVAPGYVDTPMLGGLPGGFEGYIVKKTPLRRLGRVEEIAGLVAFLASPEADFITGQVVSPNGGLVI
ncbi:MAG: SDR family oxidoreductase [Proteobacteria bacterium]|nr:SDR family oxidoreductase [Pseudomonadota bacterium]